MIKLGSWYSPDLETRVLLQPGGSLKVGYGKHWSPFWFYVLDELMVDVGCFKLIIMMLLTNVLSLFLAPAIQYS